MIGPGVAITAADVAGHYDELDPMYRDIWGEHVHHGYWRTGRESAAEAVEALSLLVGAALAPAAGQVLCDIGCGYGATAQLFAERYGAEVTGLTLSSAQAAVAQARRPVRGALTFLLRDWLDNGLPDAGFAGAYAIESSEHMADKLRFFAEAWRVLAPGGRLVVCAWLAADQPRPWQVRHLLAPICREGQLPGLGTLAEYQAMAAAAGFTVAATDDISRQVRRTWVLCLRRGLLRLLTDHDYRRFLRDPLSRNRAFALSLPRLLVALRCGAMRYCVLVLDKS